MYITFVPKAAFSLVPSLSKHIPDLFSPPVSRSNPHLYLKLAVIDQTGYSRGIFVSFVPNYAFCPRHVPDVIKNPTTSTLDLDTATGQWIALGLSLQK